MKHLIITITVLTFVLSTKTNAQELLPTGSAMPEASHSLTTTDNQTATLSSLMGEQGLVVVFWSNVCPWTSRYAERLVDLFREYAPAGVEFVAVNSNDSTRFPDENLASMRRFADSEGFSFAYVMDDGGAIARAFGARNTPHVFLFGVDRALLYDGAIDNSPADPDRVSTRYLKDAMDQSLASQTIDVQRTNALGCTIKFAE